MKKSLVILFSFILMSSFFLSGIYAQDTTDTNVAENNLPVEVPENTLASSVGYVSPDEEVISISTEEEKINQLTEEARTFDEQLSVNAGITPDSGLYFVEDKILAPFRDDSVNREIKIAEMRELAPQCGQGEQDACESMEKSFERYQKYSNNFKRDVSPEQKDEALRSSEAIRGTYIREIAQYVPAGQKAELIRDVMTQENDISIAAEIASKIQDLCQQLSQLDPNKYSEVCSSGEDAPRWQRDLDSKLTEEQREEALKFGEVMSQCFETAGQNCECEKISFPDFAEACSVAAPLATACEIENNEEACNQLDDLEMPELPAYLQDIMDRLESGINEDKYGMFLPQECEDAGVSTPKECAIVMINTHAPEECRSALLAANVQNEREGREICDKIMFEKNAPEGCIAAGIQNPQECGIFMFAENAPRECVDAGITGEDRKDPERCQQIMESQFRGPDGGFGPSCAPGTDCSGPGGYARGTGPNIKMSGGNCAGIQDSQKRLECFDNAGNYVQEYQKDFRGNFEDTQNQQRQCAEDCGRKNSAWDFSGGNCVCKAPNFQEYQQQHVDNFRQDFNNQQQQYNNYNGDFKDGKYYPSQQPGQFQPPQGMMPPQDYQQYNQQQPPTGDYQQYNQQPGTFQPPQDYQQPPTTSTSGNVIPEPSISTTTEPAPTTTSSEPAPSSEPSPVTGGVISNNKFLSWFWR